MNTPNFDRIARAYRWLEYAALGPLLERTRAHHLPALATSRRALILGDGDGRFTAALLARYPTLQADAVDLSPAMLALLKRRAPAAHIHQLDARNQLPEGQFDLVVTHFFFDCLTQQELVSLVTRVRARLTPGALWLLSDFRIPPGVLHLPARLYIRALYFAFRLLTDLRITHLPDHRSALFEVGFSPIAIHRKLFGILTIELWRAP